MMNSTRRHGESACSAILGVIIASGWAAAQVVSPLQPMDLLRNPPGAGGHPLDGMVAPAPVPPPPPPGLGEPPLAGGPFINYESPQVRPLALSSDGTRLVATNTPNNAIDVLDASGERLRLIRSIPVGLDPVAVAIQPGTQDRVVWVANHISDNVSIVDCLTGETLGVIEVGDEPANIVFNDDGSIAFVVIQGSPFIDFATAVNGDIVQEGNLVTIDTATQTILNTLHLDLNIPRGLGFRSDRVFVSALYSGNNTTVVGTIPLLVASIFTETKPIFDASPLAPYPDPHVDDPNFPDAENPKPSPLVHRIVRDAGSNGAWQQIVDLLSDENGEPDPVMVQLLAEQLDPENPDLEEAEDLIRQTIEDAEDTEDRDVLVVDVHNPAAPSIVDVIDNVGTTLTSLAVKPDDGGLYISNLEARNLVRLEPNLNGHFVDHQIVIITEPGVSNPVPRDLHGDVPGFNNTTLPNPAAQAASLSNPLEMVFTEDGSRAYVAAFGPGRVGVIDPNPFTDGPFVLGRVDVGRGPRGLALDDARKRLYVMNRTDLTISVVDVTTDNPALKYTVPLFNPEPPEVRDGRDFLFSTRFSHNFGSSCALCHVDGHLDHLAWDLGDPSGEIQPGPPNLPENPENPYANNNHPIKGPMVTLSLRGLDQHDPLHWRGDKPTFQDFNSAFANLLGGDELLPSEMDDYTDFIHTVQYGSNPFRHRDNTFRDPRAVNGIPLYGNLCNNCHQVPHDGKFLDEASGLDGGINISGPPLFAQLQLVTQMRALHKKFESDRLNGFGLIHDGREQREDNAGPLNTFLLNFFPNVGNDPVLSSQLIAFVTAFPSNTRPVVGWQVHLEGTVTPENDADVRVMIDQHRQSPSGCDVVAKAYINQELHGFHLVSSSGDLAVTFQSDVNTLHTLADLYALVEDGATLVFMAVPPGSGERIGIDQDLDGLLDGYDPCPQRPSQGGTDYDCDGDVDTDDVDILATCTTGPAVPNSDVACLAMDIDLDDDIDQNDFAAHQRCLSGDGTPFEPGCAALTE